MTTQIIIRSMTIFLLLLTVVIAWAPTSRAAEQSFQCEPTLEDEMGPFYHPNAANRNSVGTGYLLMGTVKSAGNCKPVAVAMIELWMTGPEGLYGDAWRATLFSANNGNYHFESFVPTDFGKRRPHIHIRVTAEGFKPLVTQHYPVKDAGEGLFDLVLSPSPTQ